MIWTVSHRAHKPARLIADRHYNRQKIGSDQFVPPGRCLVLLADDHKAFWVTSWPFAEYVRHAWGGAWMCSAFRNEEQIRNVDGEALRSSDLIRQAVAATRWQYGDAPALGMVTFVDEDKVSHKRDPGRCYVKAGFTRLKERTQGGLIVLQMLPADMPAAAPANGAQHDIFGLAG